MLRINSMSFMSDIIAISIPLVQLYTYQKAFMTTFSEASARLEVELITSQQRMREAFSNEALSKAKQLQTDLNDFQEVGYVSCLVMSVCVCLCMKVLL